jgi:hypothetical protein
MKILEGYEAGPGVASTDIEIDDSGGKTGINDKVLKVAFVVCPVSSVTRQSPASGYELVPKAVNSSKMNRM